MASEKSARLSALDLVISVLFEHEKKLDYVLERLALLVESLDEAARRLGEENTSTRNERTVKREIRADVDLLEKAYELGLNASEIIEGALREAISKETSKTSKLEL